MFSYNEHYSGTNSVFQQKIVLRNWSFFFCFLCILHYMIDEAEDRYRLLVESKKPQQEVNNLAAVLSIAKQFRELGKIVNIVIRNFFHLFRVFF